MTEQTNAAPATAHTFQIPNTETQMQVEYASIPDNIRLELLNKQIEAYVKNSVNQANVRFNKANEAWAAYDNACKADPAQTAVPQPEGERPTVDLLAVAVAARDRLYSGEMRKAGTRKARKTVDPLQKLVTDACVRALFESKKDTVEGYKWTDAVKEVGGDGPAYLAGIVDEKVAAGADRDELEKLVQAKYIRPAEVMLGRHTTKATEGDLIG